MDVAPVYRADVVLQRDGGRCDDRRFREHLAISCIGIKLIWVR